MKKTISKKQISAILEEWSDEFDKDFHDSYNYDMRSGNYRDLLSEVIDRIDALAAATRKRWWKR
jgi:hypothetical protein